MIINHIAIWAQDLEVMKEFYMGYFGGKPGMKYHNPHKAFSSYFICFDSGARLELMKKPNVMRSCRDVETERTGFCHVAFSLGTRKAVDVLSEKMKYEGVPVLNGPRETGDGYYECVLLDPEGNRIEITV